MCFLSYIAAFFVVPALVACMPESVKDDPMRAEFIAACHGRIEYRSMEPKKRNAYCECGYDRTMAGLSDEVTAGNDAVAFEIPRSTGCLLHPVVTGEIF